MMVCSRTGRLGALAAALALLSFSACKREQTLTEAMTLVCNLPSTFDAGGLPPNDRAPAVAREADRLVTNAEARAVLFSTEQVSWEERDRRIAGLLARAKIAHCWMLPDGTQ